MTSERVCRPSGRARSRRCRTPERAPGARPGCAQPACSPLRRRALVIGCHHLSSTVGDGDEVDHVGGVDVPVPDVHRSLLSFDRQGCFPHLELRLVRQCLDRDARVAPRARPSAGTPRRLGAALLRLSQELLAGEQRSRRIFVEPAKRCLEVGAELGIGETLLGFVPRPIERLLALQLLSAEVFPAACHVATVPVTYAGESDVGHQIKPIARRLPAPAAALRGTRGPPRCCRAAGRRW